MCRCVVGSQRLETLLCARGASCNSTAQPSLRSGQHSFSVASGAVPASLATVPLTLRLGAARVVESVWLRRLVPSGLQGTWSLEAKHHVPRGSEQDEPKLLLASALHLQFQIARIPTHVCQSLL